nr:Polyprotein [Mercurialis secovirus 1]
MESISNSDDVFLNIRRDGVDHWFKFIEQCCLEKRVLKRNTELAFHCWMAGLVESANEGWLCDPTLLHSEEGMREWTNTFLNSFTTKTQLITYSRSVFMQYCGMDLSLGSLQSQPADEELSAEAQGILSSVTRVVSILPRKFGTWVAEGALSVCDDVWDRVKKLFYSVLGSYSSIVLKWCDWIESFWDDLKKKACEFYNSSISVFKGLEEAFYLGLALTATVCLVSCIERFLVAMGLIAQPIGFVSMLMPAFVAAFCIHYSVNFFSDKIESMNQLLGFFCSKFLMEIPSYLFPGFFTNNSSDRAPNDRAQAQFAPVALLESFASMLTNMNAKSFIEVGRVASAFNNVKQAASGIQSLSSTVVTGLWKVMDTVFGIQSQALATLSITLGCDVENWLKECDAMEEYFVQYGKVDIGMLKRVRKLVCKGRRIQMVLSQEGRAVAPAIANVVFKSLERLQMLQKQMALRGTVSSRKMPFVIAFAGKSRTGKSIVARKVAESLCENEGLDVDQIYSRQGTDPFWSGYRREFVTMYDDFAATPNAACKSDEIELMPLVSLEPVALNMASIEEKGNVYFESEVIVYSSNFLDASPRSEIQDIGAFRNRRHVLVEVTRHPSPERVYNGFNTLECQQYTILRSDTFNVRESFDSYEELWAYLVNRWNDHVTEQEANLSTFRKTRNTLRAPMRALLEIIRPGELGLPEDLLHMLKERNCSYLTNIGNKIYCVKEGGAFEEFLYEGKGVLPNCGGMERVVQTVESLHCVGTLNPLVIHYLGVLVKKQWLQADLTWSVHANDLDEYVKEVVNCLEPAHKALLYCLQYHFNGDQQRGRWYTRLWESIKNTLATVFYKEVKEWPLPLKVVIGGALVVALGGAFWTVVKTLVSMSKSIAFGTAGSAVFVASAQSRQPNRNESTEYRLRNVPAKARKWSNSSRHTKFDGGPISGTWADEDERELFSVEEMKSAWIQNQTLNAENQYLMNKMHANIEVGNQSFQVLILPGKRMLICNHYMVNWKKFGSSFHCKIALNTGRTYMHFFKVQNLIQLEGSELSLYSNSTLEDIPHSLWNSLCLDVEAQCGKNINALMMSLKVDKFTNQLEYTYAPVPVQMRTRTLTVDGFEYIREVPISLEYHVPTENTDCGSLIMTCINNKWKIIGVHIAGANGWGFANLIPGSLEPPTEEVIFSAKAQHQPDHYFNTFSQENVVGSGLACVAECKPTAYIRMPKKTSLEKTPEAWHLETQVVKEPSILVSDDPRLGKFAGSYDPFSKGMEKYKNPMGQLDEGLLEEVICEMGEEWHDCVDDSDVFGDVDISTALNGIDGVEYFDSLVLGTSEGFPHCLERKHGEKGKSRFVSGEIGHLTLLPDTSVERALKHLRETVKKEVPTIYGVECPKDELLPLRKIYDEPKTRLFTVLPMEYNILMRQQFLNFVRFVMRHRKFLACKVGTNPYSREWNDIALMLQEKGDKILCCDYSSFDGICSKQMLEAILGVIQKVTGETGEEWVAKKNTLMAAGSRHAIAQARVWKVENGIPSGIPLTVILNSMMNEILIRYFFKLRFRFDNMMKNSFKNFISLAVYGDDNLISVHPSISEIFTGKYLKEEMARYNIKITDGVDKMLPTLNFRHLEQCDFLKRGFVRNKDGIYVGPLEKSSLWGQLHYVKEKGSEMIEAYLTNAENVCRELFLHSKSESASFRKRVLDLRIFPSKQFPTMAQIEAFFQEQMGNRAGNFNLSVDVMLNPELLGTLTPVNTIGENGTFSLIPNCYYGSWISHVKSENQFLVLCGIQGEDTESSMVIRFPYGLGRGGLPSAQWLRDNFFRKTSAMRRRILENYKNGKDIVFLSGNGNVIALVMATMFLVNSGIIDTAISNMAITAAITKCQNLGYLTREMPELFISPPKHGSVQNTTTYVVNSTNNGKKLEYGLGNPQHLIRFEAFETVEVQGSLEEVVVEKFKQVLKVCRLGKGEQLVVEDVALYIGDDMKFPGPYVKHFPESWYKTMNGQKATMVLAMCIGDDTNRRIKKNTVKGHISVDCGKTADGFGFDKHFVCDDGIPLALAKKNCTLNLRSF